MKTDQAVIDGFTIKVRADYVFIALITFALVFFNPFLLCIASNKHSTPSDKSLRPLPNFH